MHTIRRINIRNNTESNTSKNSRNSRKLFEFSIIEPMKVIVFDDTRIKLDLSYDQNSNQHILSFQEAYKYFSKIFFISDLHFSDSTVFDTYRNSHFSSVYEMDTKIVQSWNEKVDANSLIFILGDLVVDKDSFRAAHFLYQLNGYKIIVSGNHDPKEFSKPKVIDLTFDRMSFILVHALSDVSKNYKNPNKYYLHGHTHNGFLTDKKYSIDYYTNELLKRLKEKRALNVNLEFHEYKPLELSEVLKLIELSKK
ncbi:MAG: metallophosphoesterase family protein [Candidatus Micrarchaeota archaeon]|nr:metallophosphoesterase family protein [Candidatus Micrarchaeota archaeon]